MNSNEYCDFDYSSKKFKSSQSVEQDFDEDYALNYK